MNKTEEANLPHHYIILTIAVIIGVVGVYLRFFGDFRYVNIVANIILIIGVGIALRTVANILK